jgi:signal transduction histidine kinase
LTNTAILAFEVLQKGNVGVAGSTATVLHRSLTGTRDLIARSLAEVRLTELTIEADRQVLRAVVMNLLQNAVKFTTPGTTVTLPRRRQLRSRAH